MRIIVDTREQRPWAFPGAETRVGTLPAGDYALEGDSKFAIERKSLEDFIGTISSGWSRFLREIGRMEGAGFARKIVVVECNFEEFCFVDENRPPQHNHPRITPQFVCKRLAELSVMDVQVFFAGNAAYAAGLAYALLRERYHEIGR